MRLLWLCNMMPGAVKEAITGKEEGGGLWVDHVLKDLRQLDMQIRILCPGDGKQGQVDEQCSYATFVRCPAHEYPKVLEVVFESELKTWKPDVIHIWGTEYGHTLAMMQAAEVCGLTDRAVISIQGLCSIYTDHYAEGVPESVQRMYTFRDLLRRDNIRQQQKKFAIRGAMEENALRKARHVIGRTDWDKACVERLNPDAKYHFCNETLRPDFYEGQWDYQHCVPHRIFASSRAYPVKGFHYLLEAVGELVKVYPDITLAVPGRSFLQTGKDKLRQNSYEAYLAKLTRSYGLEEKIEFLGSLSAEQMKAEYRKANVFAMASTIENSPNSLGEAMLLGVPCVSADVGGVANLMRHKEEGFVYQPSAAYMLAYYIKQVFAMAEEAATLGNAARDHARLTHDPQTNLQSLLAIYRDLSGEV